MAHRRLNTDDSVTAAQADFVVSLVLDGLRPRVHWRSGPAVVGAARAPEQRLAPW